MSYCSVGLTHEQAVVVGQRRVQATTVFLYHAPRCSLNIIVLYNTVSDCCIIMLQRSHGLNSTDIFHCNCVIEDFVHFACLLYYFLYPIAILQRDGYDGVACIFVIYA